MSSAPKSPISKLGLFIWALAASFFLYEFFLRAFLGSVAHQVIPDLHLNAVAFSLIGSSYYLAYGIMQIPVGILADKFGVRIIMFAGVTLCAISAYMFSHATGFDSALTSRVVMGIGSSFAFVCLLVVAATWFPRKFFGFFSGLSQFIGTMGPMLAAGPMILAMNALHEDWRTMMTQIAAIGLTLAILIIVFVRNKPRDGEQALIILKNTTPIIQSLKQLVKNNQAWAVAFYSATTYVSMALLGAMWGTEFLQVQGLTQAKAANIISISWLGYAIGCPLLGALSDIAKRRKPTLVACSILGLIATAGIVYLPLTHFSWVYGMLFFLLGVAASGQNLGFAAITEHTDITNRATALGMNNGTITLSTSSIPPIASYFIYLSAANHPEQLQPENFYVAFACMPAMYVISFLISTFWFKETYCKPQKEAIVLKV